MTNTGKSVLSEGQNKEHNKQQNPMRLSNTYNNETGLQKSCQNIILRERERIFYLWLHTDNIIIYTAPEKAMRVQGTPTFCPRGE